MALANGREAQVVAKLPRPSFQASCARRLAKPRAKTCYNSNVAQFGLRTVGETISAPPPLILLV
jgi:hypothetical protein